MPSQNKQERYRGALLGLACGDALGTTLEFKKPGTFNPIDDMVGGGPFKLKPGQWTDDTSMALCLAESLVECKGFNASDQMRRYVRWYRHGYLSSTGKCFDIGNTIRKALHQYEKTGNPLSGSTHPQSAGNGSIMRLAPVPLAYAEQPKKAIELSGQSSRTTHGTRASVDACHYLGGLIVGAINGAEKHELLSVRYCPIPNYWESNPLVAEIDEIAAGSFKEKTPPVTTNPISSFLSVSQSSSANIKGSGYVVASLEAALWAFFMSRSFSEGCLLAVNLGDDADTTGAIYGQLAGAFYGESEIPESWRNKLAMKDTIESLADKLFELSQTNPK